MNWLYPALIAPAIYTIGNFIDKYLVSKEIKDYRGMPIYASVMGLVLGTLIWFIAGFPTLSLRDTVIVLTTGILSVWAAALYFRAISKDDASKLILLFQMTPVLTLILAFLFLKERISYPQLLGFILILFAVLIVSVERAKTKIILSETFFLILIVDLMLSASAVLMKFALDANSFLKVLNYQSWGIAVGGTILYLFFPAIREAFNKSIRTVRKKALVIMFANEGLFVISKSITFFAYFIGPVALVSVLASTQVFYGIIYGLIFTLIFPQIIKEDISKEEVIKKCFSAAVLFIGILLVNQ